MRLGVRREHDIVGYSVFLCEKHIFVQPCHFPANVRVVDRQTVHFDGEFAQVGSRL